MMTHKRFIALIGVLFLSALAVVLVCNAGPKQEQRTSDLQVVSYSKVTVGQLGGVIFITKVRDPHTGKEFLVSDTGYMVED